MAFGTNIRTWFNGSWHDGDIPVMRAADHGIWQGSSIFDGARLFEGMTPDLDKHCARANRSAEALLMQPTMTPEAMIEIALEGLKAYGPTSAVYIRPMYWAQHGNELGVSPQYDSTLFAMSLEEVPMPAFDKPTTLSTTRFRRPVLENAVCNAKAGCLYPNNARMLMEAKSKGYGNALVTDAMGNVAETATANVFMVKDGEYFTPIANGTFLSGITRARHIANLRAAGEVVHEAILTYEDFHNADEVFLSGNFAKVTAVKEFEGTQYGAPGPKTKLARELYWDWAKSDAARKA